MEPVNEADIFMARRKNMKKKIGVFFICATLVATMCACDKEEKKSEDTTENVTEAIVVVSPEEGIKKDIASAKMIRVAVETAMSNENIYNEISGKHTNELIIVTEDGLAVLGDEAKNDISSTLGKLPEVMYRDNGADHFAFEVDASNYLTIYACDANNTKKWELDPNKDVIYGGEEVTEKETEEEEDTEEENLSPEQNREADISSAKSLYIVVSNMLGNESLYDELTSEHAGECIIFTEKGLKKISEKARASIMQDLNDKLPKVKDTSEGAKYFAFEVDEYGNILIYAVNKDASKKWILVPEQGDEVTTEAEIEEAPNVSQVFESHVGEAIVRISLEFAGNTGYMFFAYGSGDQFYSSSMHKEGDSWISDDGQYTLTYSPAYDSIGLQSPYDSPLVGDYGMVSQSIH